MYKGTQKRPPFLFGNDSDISVTTKLLKWIKRKTERFYRVVVSALSGNKTLGAVDVSGWSAGIYFIHVINAASIVVRRKNNGQ